MIIEEVKSMTITLKRGVCLLEEIELYYLESMLLGEMQRQLYICRHQNIRFVKFQWIIDQAIDK